MQWIHDNVEYVPGTTTVRNICRRGMTRVRICHTTTYRYAEPVAFGIHRLVIRPREGHDVQVESLSLWSESGRGGQLASGHFWKFDRPGFILRTRRFSGIL